MWLNKIHLNLIAGKIKRIRHYTSMQLLPGFVPCISGVAIDCTVLFFVLDNQVRAK